MQITDSSPISRDVREKMARFRARLLDAGMAEPTKRSGSSGHWLFYRQATELTAFIVNLTGTECYIEIMYGFASTAFTRMAGDENALVELGVGDDDITLREKLIICDEADEEAARARIGQMYDRFRNTPKDALLDEAKEKRKAFIRQIAGALKPLGFRKKANTWTRALEGEYCLMFNAQKSSYADTYYFNVYIGKNGSGRYGDCYYTRLAPPGMSPMDWQALDRDEFAFFLDRTVVPALERILRTPLEALGKLPQIWSGCACDRKKCESCWVEKNLWEARGNP